MKSPIRDFKNVLNYAFARITMKMFSVTRRVYCCLKYIY